MYANRDLERNDVKNQTENHKNLICREAENHKRGITCRKATSDSALDIIGKTSTPLIECKYKFLLIYNKLCSTTVTNNS